MVPELLQAQNNYPTQQGSDFQEVGTVWQRAKPRSSQANQEVVEAAEWVAAAYHGVRVRDEVFKCVQEALVLYQLGVDVVKLGHTYSRCLANIRVFILQALPERLAKILCDLVNADAAHSPHSQGPDQRVGVLTVLRGTSHWPEAEVG